MCYISLMAKSAKEKRLDEKLSALSAEGDSLRSRLAAIDEETSRIRIALSVLSDLDGETEGSEVQATRQPSLRERILNFLEDARMRGSEEVFNELAKTDPSVKKNSVSATLSTLVSDNVLEKVGSGMYRVAGAPNDDGRDGPDEDEQYEAWREQKMMEDTPNI